MDVRIKSLSGCKRPSILLICSQTQQWTGRAGPPKAMLCCLPATRQSGQKTAFLARFLTWPIACASPAMTWKNDFVQWLDGGPRFLGALQLRRCSSAGKSEMTLRMRALTGWMSPMRMMKVFGNKTNSQLCQWICHSLT